MDIYKVTLFFSFFYLLLFSAYAHKGKSICKILTGAFILLKNMNDFVRARLMS